MLLVTEAQSFQSDQWQAVGLVLTALTTLAGTALTIWGGIITKKHEVKIKQAELSNHRQTTDRRVIELYENALLIAAANLNAITFFGSGDPKQIELLSKTAEEINQAIEKGEQILNNHSRI